MNDMNNIFFINKNTTSGDLNIMKALYADTIGLGELERVNNFIDLIQILRRMYTEEIAYSNEYLSNLLTNIGRVDLADKFVKLKRDVMPEKFIDKYKKSAEDLKKELDCDEMLKTSKLIGEYWMDFAAICGLNISAFNDKNGYNNKAYEVIEQWKKRKGYVTRWMVISVLERIDQHDIIEKYLGKF